METTQSDLVGFVFFIGLAITLTLMLTWAIVESKWKKKLEKAKECSETWRRRYDQVVEKINAWVETHSESVTRAEFARTELRFKSSEDLERDWAEEQIELMKERARSIGFLVRN